MLQRHPDLPREAIPGPKRGGGTIGGIREKCRELWHTGNETEKIPIRRIGGMLRPIFGLILMCMIAFEVKIMFA